MTPQERVYMLVRRPLGLQWPFGRTSNLSALSLGRRAVVVLACAILGGGGIWLACTRSAAAVSIRMWNTELAISVVDHCLVIRQSRAHQPHCVTDGRSYVLDASSAGDVVVPLFLAAHARKHLIATASGRTTGYLVVASSVVVLLLLLSAAACSAGALWLFRKDRRSGFMSCRHCGYCLRGLQEARCPECGRVVDLPAAVR